MCWAGPGFPWKQAQAVAAEEAFSLLPGDRIRRQQCLCHRTVGQWPSTLRMLTPGTGQALLGMDTPWSPNPMWLYVPSGCSWHSWQHSKMETTQWCISEASSNASGSVQVAEYSGTWEKQEAQRFRVQTREPDSLGPSPRPASHCCVAPGRRLAAPCLSFSIYKMGMRRLTEHHNRITSPPD